ncbi:MULTISPECIES: hypothetical protein [Deinococcus]|uniref:Uncharacterized protein n=1 Tax=Deinococcus rufus TaxID=2136097 RepID=A0ABV7Z7U6_9DEIO|nr:hypothetical protein [Deinococcus sp. AB2017081]WQE96188.1 hypothetical protein U2P90_04640 [Deinococcus sp. AB2017081]
MSADPSGPDRWTPTIRRGLLGGVIWAGIVVVVAGTLFGAPWEAREMAGLLGWAGLAPVVLAGGLAQARYDQPGDRRAARAVWDHVASCVIAALAVFSLQQFLLLVAAQRGI